MTTKTFNLTLSSQAFYILLSLVEHPLHGYGIRDQVAHDSESRLILAPGSVYIILKRLIAQGLVERFEEGRFHQAVIRYRLTPDGRRRLADEAKRLNHAVIDAQRKLGHNLAR